MELKGVFDLEHLEQIKGLDAIRELAAGRAVSRILTTTYFDTPDLALRRHGLSLRVRKIGNTYTQCLKHRSKPLGGIMVRTEWEVQLPNEAPQIDLIENKKIRNKLRRLGAENLQSVFQCVVRRQSRKLEFDDGTTISLDIDVGEVTAGDAAQSICEFELELLSGSPAHVFDLAATINRTVPFRLSTVSKAARGYTLLSKDEPQAVKWQKSNLAKSSTAEETFTDNLRQAISHLQANEAAVLLNDAEGIHQMRIAIRRLRAGLAIFQFNILEAKYDWVVGEAKWLMHELSSARSWDVFIDEFVAPVAKLSKTGSGFEALMSVAKKERSLHRKQAHSAISSARYTEFLLELSIWLCRDIWRDNTASPKPVNMSDPFSRVCTKQLKKQQKNLKKMGRKLAKMSEDDRHQLRLSVKKLRYTIDFCAHLYPERKVSAFKKKLKPVQAGLGYLNDVPAAESLLQKLMDRHPDNVAPPWLYSAGMVIGWHRREARLIEKLLFQDVAQLLGTKPFWENK
jgi:inorganic triphosphatase YgiF